MVKSVLVSQRSRPCLRRGRIRKKTSPTTESEDVDAVDEDDSGELSNSLGSSSSTAAIRRLRDRVPTPGPRRSVSANQHGSSASPRSAQVAEPPAEENADEAESQIGVLERAKSPQNRKLRIQMRRCCLSYYIANDIRACAVGIRGTKSHERQVDNKC